ncbi:MAG: HU family DNA-binding protein [Elusimicrobia bacterium]|nr:HU family DNA-binding protein [Elusimicrobiota bacterium]MBU2614005.1 HU family DNA-binding protein [Elusimicrobiota bacterium]
MNKKGLIEALTSVLSTKTEAKNATEKIFSTMQNALKSGEKVIVSGFGSFNIKLVRAKKMLNPKTRKVMLINPKKKVKFKPAKNLLI